MLSNENSDAGHIKFTRAEGSPPLLYITLNASYAPGAVENIEAYTRRKEEGRLSSMLIQIIGMQENNHKQQVFFKAYRVPRISENCYRVPRIREIGPLQVHTGYLTFSLKKHDEQYYKWVDRIHIFQELTRWWLNFIVFCFDLNQRFELEWPWQIDIKKTIHQAVDTMEVCLRPTWNIQHDPHQTHYGVATTHLGTPVLTEFNMT